MPASPYSQSRVVVAGASGFVGRALLPALSTSRQVIGLSRHAKPNDSRFVACDLFSMSSTRRALQGADTAVYLVHSMMPSSRLFQGSFHDTDLLLADNFARACRDNGVRRIVYLGGLVPEGRISQHLESRREVELVLAEAGAELVAVRAGMIVGSGGSSFDMLQRLVERLPMMVLPAWTQRHTQAVHLDDVVRVLVEACCSDRFCSEQPTLEGTSNHKIVQLVNGECLTYEQLLRTTAERLGKRRVMVPVPISSTGFSKRWVQLFSGASYELTSPLIDSLLCDLPNIQPSDSVKPLLRWHRFADMLEAIAAERPAERPTEQPQSDSTTTTTRIAGEASPAFVAQALAVQAKRVDAVERAYSVRSVQRLVAHPIAADAIAISTEYFEWLARLLRPFISVRASEAEPGRYSIVLFGLALLVLSKQPPATDSTRVKFHIVGGLLTANSTTGWLEFRQLAHRRFTLAAIHGFVPALPWRIYVFTQAPIHEWVMRAFARHLGRRISPNNEQRSTHVNEPDFVG